MEQSSRVPRYQVLADSLRGQIEAGTYGHGARLPSEPELCRRFGVSRGTVVKAIEQLVAAGLATRKQGAGTFVARASLRREPGRLLSFTETVAAQGRAAGQQILAFEPADAAQCKSLGCFEPAMRLTRLRLVDGVTTSLHHCVVPSAIIEQLSEVDRAQLHTPGVTDFSLYAAFEAAGVEIASASEFVAARLADGSERQQLGLVDPAAVMVITRQSSAADGRLIEVTEAIYQAECYTYETSLLRGAGQPVPFRLRDLSDPEPHHEPGRLK